jgi:alkylglycerol monooxygenase
MTVALMIESAALATATAALGHIELHRVFKPLTMLIAIVFVVGQQAPMRPGGRFSFEKWLLAAALAASLAGDAFLMFPGFFIPGLVSFLVAHLLYIALFRRDAPWFASRGALAATLAVGGGMYAFLWQGGLPVALRIPVAAYVVVIALMAAQAIGRAAVLRDRAALGVAIGAGFFMLSDSLLAVNRFVSPLPMSQVWVLSTYYAAQLLIVYHLRSHVK